MPERNVEQDGLYSRINSLEEEIAELKYSNQKLYKDCVTFAKKLKKIQVSGILDEDIDGLKNLNSQYEDEIAALKEQIVKLTVENQDMRNLAAEAKAQELNETISAIEEELPVVLEQKKRSTLASVDEIPVEEEADLYSDSLEAPSKETLENADVANAAKTGNTVSFAKLPDLAEEDDEEPEVGPAMKRSNKEKAKQTTQKAPVVKKTKSRKGPLGRRILRGILKTLLILVLLVGLVSGVVGLYAHTWTDKTFFGVRAYTVRDDNMDPNVKQSDVVLVKDVDMNRLQPSNVILNDRGSRTFASVEVIENLDGTDYLVVADNTGNSYRVSNEEYLGKAIYKMANLGRITKYALTHRINYFAVLLSIAMVLIALLILFPSRKPRRRDQPKFGRDYTVEDFTI